MWLGNQLRSIKALQYTCLALCLSQLGGSVYGQIFSLPRKQLFFSSCFLAYIAVKKPLNFQSGKHLIKGSESVTKITLRKFVFYPKRFTMLKNHKAENWNKTKILTTKKMKKQTKKPPTNQPKQNPKTTKEKISQHLFGLLGFFSWCLYQRLFQILLSHFQI